MKQVPWFYFFLTSTAIAQPFSLKEAIHYAVEHSPSLAQEFQRDRIADLELTNRSRAFYPSLDFDSSHGVGQTKPQSPNEPWLSSVELKLTEKLYDNGQSWIRYTQGKNLREAQRLRYQRARDLLVLDVMKNFYALSRLLKTLEVRQTQKKLLDQQSATVSRLYQQGLKTKRDFLRFKADAQRAAIDTRAARNASDKARLELLRQLGGLPTDNTSLSFDLIPPQDLRLEASPQALPLEGTYEYKISKLDLEAQKSEADLSRRNYWPQLGLSAGAYYRNGSYLGSSNRFSANEQTGWNAMLSLTYNLWDWGIRAREVEKEDARVLLSENDLRKQINTVQSEIQQLQIDLSDYTANLSVTEELLKAQEDAYNVIKRDYSEGRTEYQDLITSLTNLLAAQISFFEARYQLAELLARAHYYRGTLYGTLSQ